MSHPITSWKPVPLLLLVPAFLRSETRLLFPARNLPIRSLAYGILRHIRFFIAVSSQ